jgi:hypothetical protein
MRMTMIRKRTTPQKEVILEVKRTIALEPFMQKYPFFHATGATWSYLERCVQSGDVALHLIDGTVQLNTLEALRALSKFPRYRDLAKLADEFEQQLAQSEKIDLFA